MTESKARVEKIPDEPWNTLLYQKEGNAQRIGYKDVSKRLKTELEWVATGQI